MAGAWSVSRLGGGRVAHGWNQYPSRQNQPTIWKPTSRPIPRPIESTSSFEFRALTMGPPGERVPHARTHGSTTQGPSQTRGRAWSRGVPRTCEAPRPGAAAAHERCGVPLLGRGLSGTERWTAYARLPLGPVAAGDDGQLQRALAGQEADVQRHWRRPSIHFAVPLAALSLRLWSRANTRWLRYA